MYKFTVVIKLRVSLNFTTAYRGLMVLNVGNLKCGQRDVWRLCLGE
jgi:hypothetical protein